MSENGPMTGKLFNGRYEIGDRIGIGGMAEVYSAQDVVLGRLVAVKVMLPQFADDPDFARRFRQEAAAAANLQSPYIVNVYDWGHDDDTYFIVMEYVRGSDLKTAIEQRGAINQRKVAEIGAQVCQALTVAHAQDIIHRDVKPQNIMVQPDGNVKVMDFGIARAKNSVSDKTQTVLGTAHYISPEQAQGMELTATSDIYSLGVVLYEAATGTLPFDGPDAVSVALMQVKDFPPAPHEINPDIDPAFEAIILKAMEKDPNQRFATANDMRLALNDYLAGRSKSRNGFTSAQTSVIAPIGAVAGADTTQVMPVTPVTHGKNGKQQGQVNYRSSTPDKKKSNVKKGVIGAIIAIVAIAAIAFAVFALMSPGEKVPVPDVVNKPLAEATATLEAAGFQIGKTESAFDTNIEAGSIISQSPKAGEEEAKGSKVNLVISQGTEQVNVPNVEGKTLSEATQILTREGFVVGDTTEEYDEETAAGKVVSQNPAANAKAAKGSEVKIVLSKGKEEETVPDIEGKSLEAARAAVEGVGLKLAQSGEGYSDSIAKDCVISQSPAAGSKVAKESTVSYVISLGPENVTVPNVVGQSQANATAALEQAGFQVNVVTNPSSSVAKGKVIEQSPEAGSRMTKGTTISINVSTGPASSASSSSRSNTTSR